MLIARVLLVVVALLAACSSEPDFAPPRLAGPAVTKLSNDVPVGDGWITSWDGGFLYNTDHSRTLLTSRDGRNWRPTFLGSGDVLSERSVAGHGKNVFALAATSSLVDVWRTEDAEAWTRVPLPGVSAADKIFLSIAAGPRGVVVVGFDRSSGPSDQYGQTFPGYQIWYSPDGRSFDRKVRVVHPKASSHQVPDVVATHDGFLLTGHAENRETATIFSSPDGTRWDDISGQVSEDYFLTPGRSGDVTVVFGHVPVEDYRQELTVWARRDGETEWRKGTIDIGKLPDLGVVGLTALNVHVVLPWEGGFLAVGGAHAQGQPPVGIVWTSPDGLAWTRMPVRDNGFDRVTTMIGAAPAGDGLALFGLDRKVDAMALAMWRTDGVTPPEPPVAEQPAVGVVDFSPWSDRTLLPRGATVVRRTGDCLGPSVASGRNDAWRCKSGDTVLDPCIAQPVPMEHVACLTGPREMTVVRMPNVLPIRGGLAEQRTVWLAVLEDGGICRAETSTKPPERDGTTLSMRCDGSRFIWGAPHRDRDRWVVRLSAGERGPLDTVEVKAFYR